MKAEEKIEYYPNGKLWYRNHYLNGKVHGLQQIWYRSGQLWYQDFHLI